MYGISKKLNLDFDEAVEKARGALQQEGFGVLTEIDVKDTLRKKLDVDFRRYIILGACNPPLAHKALTAELQVGLLLPCNVIVYENEDGGSTVSAINASEMMTFTGNDALAGVADAVNLKLQTVIEAM